MGFVDTAATVDDKYYQVAKPGSLAERLTAVARNRIFADFAVTRNFNTVERFLSDPGSATIASDIHAIGRDRERLVHGRKRIIVTAQRRQLLGQPQMGLRVRRPRRDHVLGDVDSAGVRRRLRACGM